MGATAVVPAGAEIDRLVIVPLTAGCNNHCVFCPLGDGPWVGSGLEKDLVDRLLQSTDLDRSARICLVGGEPTLLDDLPELIARARTLGHASVLLQTNGRRLAYPKYRKALLEAGLGAVDVSLHGPRAAVHDYHTRAPGSFRQTVTALRALATTSLEVGVTTVVTRSNYRHLGELVRLLSSVGVEAVHIFVAQPVGTASRLFASVIPRLCLVAPHVRAASELGARLGIFVAVSGLPPCLAGLTRLLPQSAARGSFGPRCIGCASAHLCPGLSSAYADRYGFGEVFPRSEPAGAHSVGDDSRCLRFAGTHPKTVFAGKS